MSKRCSRCKLDKDEEDFARLHCAPDGRQYACRVCLSAAYTVCRQKRLSYYRSQKRRYYHQNRDAVLARHRANAAHRKVVDTAWVKRNRPKVHAIQKRYKMTPQGRDKREHDNLMQRHRSHKVTIDQYHAKAESQDFLCAICHEMPLARQGRRGSVDGFHLDHDHKTDRFRGLLCGTCNIGIGMLKEKLENFRNAITYLTPP